MATRTRPGSEGSDVVEICLAPGFGAIELCDSLNLKYQLYQLIISKKTLCIHIHMLRLRPFLHAVTTGAFRDQDEQLALDVSLLLE